MKAKDKAEDQAALQKLKLKIRRRQITRKTIINGGENLKRHRPLCKEIKTDCPKSKPVTASASTLARTGQAGGSARACGLPVSTHTL